MTDLKTIVECVTVRRDGFTPSRPWCADVLLKNGDFWKNWSYNFKTRRSLLQHIKAVAGDVTVVQEYADRVEILT